MKPLTITLPDDLRVKAEQRATEAGHENVEAFVEALVRSEVEGEMLDEDIEEELLRRLDDGPGIEATPEFWKNLRASLVARVKQP